MSIEWLGHADIETYRITKKSLMKIDISSLNDEEASHVRSMISDCEYVLSWLRCGHRPDGYYGIESKRKVTGDQLSMEQRYVWVDPQMIQSYVRGGCGSPTALSDSDLFMLEDALSELSPMQRECYTLAKGRLLTHDEISFMLSIDRRNVATHIQRAELKISKKLTEHSLISAM